MRWDIISLPALAEEDEGFRKAGEALWPERFDVEALKDIMRTDPVTWECSYQQRPTVGGGCWFDSAWLHYYDKIQTKMMNLYIIVDPALNRTKHSDFTVIWVVGANQDRNFYWVDIIRERMDPVVRADRIFQLHRKWRPLHVGYEEYGLQSDVTYLRERMERENYRFPVVELGRSGIWHNTSKPERIRTLVSIARTGRLWLPNPELQDRDPVVAEAVRGFVSREWSRYPAVDYDDTLDVMSRINDPDMRIVFPMPTEGKRDIPDFSTAGSTWMSL